MCRLKQFGRRRSAPDAALLRRNRADANRVRIAWCSCSARWPLCDGDQACGAYVARAPSTPWLDHRRVFRLHSLHAPASQLVRAIIRLFAIAAAWPRIGGVGRAARRVARGAWRWGGARTASDVPRSGDPGDTGVLTATPANPRCAASRRWPNWRARSRRRACAAARRACWRTTRHHRLLMFICEGTCVCQYNERIRG